MRGTVSLFRLTTLDKQRSWFYNGSVSRSNKEVSQGLDAKEVMLKAVKAKGEAKANSNSCERDNLQIVVRRKK